MRRILKSIIAEGLWAFLREKAIKRKHCSVVDSIRPLLSVSTDDYWNKTGLRAKKEFPENSKLVWQYWGQGVDSDRCPELVKLCVQSVNYYKGDCTVVVLDDSNLHEYIDLPEFVADRRSNYSITHFSDLLRTILLSVYGGVWLDASVLLTGSLPDEIFDRDSFYYQRDMSVAYKSYWKSSYAYYWNWDDDFKVRVLAGIMGAKKNSHFMKSICVQMLELWRQFDSVPDYFVFSILINENLARNPNWRIPVVSDTVPHILRQHINGNYPYLSIEDTLKLTPIHSLNYKNPDAYCKLRAVLTAYRPDLMESYDESRLFNSCS